MRAKWAAGGGKAARRPYSRAIHALKVYKGKIAKNDADPCEPFPEIE